MGIKHFQRTRHSLVLEVLRQLDNARLNLVFANNIAILVLF